MAVIRHQFSPDVQRQLAELRKLDNWHAPMALAADWAVIVCVIALCERLLSGWAWWLGYVLLALPVIGTRQRALATLLHEAAHGVLARDRMLGRLLGTLPSGYLILQSLTAYRRSHLKDHHGGFGDPFVDPDLRAHLSHGLYRPMTGRAFAVRFLIAPLFGVRTPRLVVELLTQRLSGSAPELLAGLGVVTYFGGAAAACFLLGAGELFLLYWAVPLFLVFPVINWYVELLEHFPMVGQEDVDILTSRPRATGPITRHLFGIHGEGYHLDHHLSPTIPYWNLRKAHRIRLADPDYHAAVQRTAPAGHGILWQFRDMSRQVDSGGVSARLRTLLEHVDDAPPSRRARDRTTLGMQRQASQALAAQGRFSEYS